jgi:hypothetical protein
VGNGLIKKIGMTFLFILGALTQFVHGFWFFLGRNKEDDGGGKEWLGYLLRGRRFTFRQI